MLPSLFHAEVPAWQWYGAGVKRQGIKGKSRKTFYKAIKRGNEIVEVGNLMKCNVFMHG